MGFLTIFRFFRISTALKKKFNYLSVRFSSTLFRVDTKRYGVYNSNIDVETGQNYKKSDVHLVKQLSSLVMVVVGEGIFMLLWKSIIQLNVNFLIIKINTERF